MMMMMDKWDKAAKGGEKDKGKSLDDRSKQIS